MFQCVSVVREHSLPSLCPLHESICRMGSEARGRGGEGEKKSTGFFSCHAAFQCWKMDLSLSFLYSTSPNLSGQIAGDRWRDTVTWHPVPNGLPAVALSKDRSTRRRRHFSQKCRRQHTTTTPRRFSVATRPTRCRERQRQPPMGLGGMMPRSQCPTTSRPSSRRPIWMWIPISVLHARYSHWAAPTATSSSSS